MPEEIKDIGTSVRFRLLEISKEKGLNFEVCELQLFADMCRRPPEILNSASSAPQ